MSEKVALVTGGTSGIGLAVAKMLFAAGLRVVIIGRSEKRGDDAVRTFSNENDESAEDVMFVAADVRRVSDCEKIVDETIARYGRLDVLINSAGVYVENDAAELTEEEYERVMDTNVKGAMFVTRFAIPHIKKTHGNIVNVSSDAGVHGNYFCTLYSASKGALTLYTRSLALELAHEGVRVNAVCPGDIMTPLTERQIASAPSREDALREMASVYPLGRIGTSDEAASVICFLASERASFVTGAVWSVDGGLTA